MPSTGKHLSLYKRHQDNRCSIYRGWSRRHSFQAEVVSFEVEPLGDLYIYSSTTMDLDN